MSTREFGFAAENLAQSWLSNKGYRILEKNYRSRRGEIDIICQDGETVVFVEVKSRSSSTFGSPAQAVHSRKQHRMRQLAQQYIIERRLENHPVRFDVISILVDRNQANSSGRHGPTTANTEIEHIIGAF